VIALKYSIARRGTGKIPVRELGILDKAYLRGLVSWKQAGAVGLLESAIMVFWK
jgi:hypothetical protein